MLSASLLPLSGGKPFQMKPFTLEGCLRWLTTSSNSPYLVSVCGTVWHRSQKRRMAEQWERLEPACRDLLRKAGAPSAQPTLEDFTWAQAIYWWVHVICCSPLCCLSTCMWEVKIGVEGLQQATKHSDLHAFVHVASC